MTARLNSKFFSTLHRLFLNSQSKRTILSQAYLCDQEWEKRKLSPALKDVEPFELLNTLIIRTQGDQLTSPIDLDIAANALNNAIQLKDFEDLLFKFRHNKNSVSILDSTHHAVIRAYIKLKKENKLMQFLADPINYGIFPDSYGANLLMDNFLNAGNTRDAAKTACFIMQQEELKLPSTRWMMIFSCASWLKNPSPENWLEKMEDEEEIKTPDDDEEIIFRVPFLKTRYFDNHFDLENPAQLIGKTLCWTSKWHLLNAEKHVEIDDESNQVFVNCYLLGSILWQNELEFNCALEMAKKWSISIFKDFEELIPKAETKEESVEEKKNAPISEDVAENPAHFLSNVPNLLAELRKSDQSFLDSVETGFKDFLAKNEKIDIESQHELFEVWNANREHKIDNQIKNFLKQERLRVIRDQLETLKRESEHMFFFENKEQMEKRLLQEEPSAEQSAEGAAEKKTGQEPADLMALLSRSARKKKLKALKHHQMVMSLPADEDYVVPELGQKPVSLANK